MITFTVEYLDTCQEPTYTKTYTVSNIQDAVNILEREQTRTPRLQFKADTEENHAALCDAYFKYNTNPATL